MPNSQRADEVLNSWKEIACYLNRGVRTVQRWEADLDLPVRRPRGTRRSAVLAMRSEINQWLSDCPLAALETEQPPEGCFDGRSEAVTQNLSTQPQVGDLILRSRQLRSNLQRSCEELETALSHLLSNMQRISQPSGGGLRTRSNAA